MKDNHYIICYNNNTYSYCTLVTTNCIAHCWILHEVKRRSIGTSATPDITPLEVSGLG